MKIRAGTTADEPEIRKVITDAFGRPDESGLVVALRTAGDITHELVAAIDDKIQGHVALSRLQSPSAALALAPVSVAPEHQRRGIGSALIKAAIDLAAKDKYLMIFVVGDPDYYTRFGFSTKTATAYPSAYAGPYFMALGIGDTLPPPAPVIFPDAFSDID